jgi:hypothetical protein
MDNVLAFVSEDEGISSLPELPAAKGKESVVLSWKQ